MKTLRLFTLAAALLLAWGCGGDDNAPDPVEMTLRWDDLTHFGVSDIGRIDVTTADGTRQCNVSNGGRFYLADPSATIESVTVHFTNDRGSIRVGEGEFTVSGTTLSIARDLSAVTLVYDRATLEFVRDNLAGNYLQIRDIDLSAGGIWAPIGDVNPYFTGTYDGGGLAIRNMKVEINASGYVYAGLFGVNKVTLRNIHLEGGSVSVTSNSDIWCGGVCGYSDGTITACSNTGSVSGESETATAKCGGVCGENGNGTITACYNTGSVSATSTSDTAYSGGVCGYNQNGAITACYNTGVVSATSTSDTAYSGGVCGDNRSSGTITACYNTGAVNGTGTNAYNGGVSGANTYGSTITYCYWGGASADLVGIAKGTTTGATKFGSGAWPESTMPGWGSDVWESLGGWNGGGNNTVFPTLK